MMWLPHSGAESKVAQGHAMYIVRLSRGVMRLSHWVQRSDFFSIYPPFNVIHLFKCCVL